MRSHRLHVGAGREAPELGGAVADRIWRVRSSWGPTDWNGVILPPMGHYGAPFGTGEGRPMARGHRGSAQARMRRLGCMEDYRSGHVSCRGWEVGFEAARGCADRKPAWDGRGKPVSCANRIWSCPVRFGTGGVNELHGFGKPSRGALGQDALSPGNCSELFHSSRPLTFSTPDRKPNQARIVHPCLCPLTFPGGVEPGNAGL